MTLVELTTYLLNLVFYPFRMGGTISSLFLGFAVIIFVFGLIHRIVFIRGCP